MTTTILENAAKDVKGTAANKWSELKPRLQRLGELTRDRGKAADKLIRSHPYETLGLVCGAVFGLGLLVGALVRRA